MASYVPCDTRGLLVGNRIDHSGSAGEGTRTGGGSGAFSRGWDGLARGPPAGS